MSNCYSDRPPQEEEYPTPTKIVDLVPSKSWIVCAATVRLFIPNEQNIMSDQNLGTSTTPQDAHLPFAGNLHGCPTRETSYVARCCYVCAIAVVLYQYSSTASAAPSRLCNYCYCAAVRSSNKGVCARACAPSQMHRKQTHIYTKREHSCSSAGLVC